MTDLSDKDQIELENRKLQLERYIELENRKIELERYKAWLNFWKFVGGSIVAAIVIAAIPPFFQLATSALESARKERELVQSKVTFHESYIKEFLQNALRQDIEGRLRLAAYFSNVSDEEFKTGWQDYLRNLNDVRKGLREQINLGERTLYQLQQERPQDQVKILELERNLKWQYGELGYLEPGRDVVKDPRSGELPKFMLGNFGITCIPNPGNKQNARQVYTHLLTLLYSPEASSISDMEDLLRDPEKWKDKNPTFKFVDEGTEVYSILRAYAHSDAVGAEYTQEILKNSSNWTAYTVEAKGSADRTLVPIPAIFDKTTETRLFWLGESPPKPTESRELEALSLDLNPKSRILKLLGEVRLSPKWRQHQIQVTDLDVEIAEDQRCGIRAF
jgi:hypothetical protein